MAPWLGFGVLFALLYTMLTMVVVDLPVPADRTLFAEASTTAIGIFCALGIVRLIYGILYISLYDYVIQNGNLIVTKGVLLRKQGSYPLRRISDVYTSINWRTLLFGLYTVEVLTPSRESKDFCTIEGLSHRAALALKERLLKMIERSEQDQKVQITASEPKQHAYVRHSLVARRHPRTELLPAH